MTAMHVAFVGPHIFVSSQAAMLLESNGTWEYVSDFPSVEAVSDVSQRADVLATWAPISLAMAKALSSRTKAIVSLATGQDGLVDLETRAVLDARGIVTMYTPSYATEAVAEFNVLSAGAIERHVVSSNDARRAGDVNFMPFVGTGLRDATFGIVGLGAIGAETARLASRLGANVIAWNRSDAAFERSPEVTPVALEDLFATASHIVLAVALNDDTKYLVAEPQLKSLRPRAVVVNTARPDVIDPKAVLRVLAERPDVQLLIDDLGRGNDDWQAVVSLANVVVTPHIAFNTVSALHACTLAAARDAVAWASGTPVNEYR